MECQVLKIYTEWTEGVVFSTLLTLWSRVGLGQMYDCKEVR